MTTPLLCDCDCVDEILLEAGTRKGSRVIMLTKTTVPFNYQSFVVVVDVDVGTHHNALVVECEDDVACDRVQLGVPSVFFFFYHSFQHCFHAARFSEFRAELAAQVAQLKAKHEGINPTLAIVQVK